MNPVVLQINKEVEHNAVVELVDHIFFTGVDDLHLIAEIHIDFFRELGIKSDKPSVLVESCLRSDNARLPMSPFELKKISSKVTNDQSGGTLNL
jgi:hypothetical protein